MEKERRNRFWLVGCLVFWSCFLARQDAPPQAVEKIIEVKATNFEYVGDSYKLAVVDSQKCFVFSGSETDTLWAVVVLNEALLLRDVDLISATPSELQGQVYRVELYDLLLNNDSDTVGYTFKHREEPKVILQFKTGDERLNRRQKVTVQMKLEEVNEFLIGNAVGILVTRMPQLLEDHNGRSYFFGVRLHTAENEHLR
jgi:hypothetical protein